MKKAFLSIALGAILVLSFVFVACNRNSTEIKPTKTKTTNNQNKSTNNTLNYAYLGDLHNQGLALALVDFDRNTIYNNSNEIANALSANAIQHLNTLAGWSVSSMTSSSGLTVSALMEKVIVKNYHMDTKKGWDEGIKDFEHILSSRERALIDRARRIFDTDFAGMTRFQIGTYIRNETDLILKDYNSIEWNVGEGECAGLGLNVMRASANFWKDIDESETPVYTTQSLIQVDTGVAIVAWGWCALGQLYDGTFSASGQWGRMRIALGAGLCASTGGLVRHW